MLDSSSVLSLIDATLHGMLLALLLLLAFAMLRLSRQNVRPPLAQATAAMMLGLCVQVVSSVPPFEATVPAL